MNRRLGTELPFTKASEAEIEWVFVEKEIEALLKIKRPCRVFLGDMTDLLHEAVPYAWLDRIFAAAALVPHVTVQILTKRTKELYHYMRERDWSDTANELTDRYRRRLEGPLYLAGEIVPPLPNVHLGVSVGNQDAANDRVPWLLKTPATIRFLSCEPLLGPINVDKLTAGWRQPGFSCLREVYPLDGLMAIPDADWEVGKISWAICGGESGHSYRPMHLDWLTSLVEQCQAADVRVFVKQDHGLRPGRQGRIPDHIWALKEFPEVGRAS